MLCLVYTLLCGLCAVLQAQQVIVKDKVTGFLGQEVILPCTLSSNDATIRVTQVMWVKDGINVAVFSPQHGTHVQDNTRIQFQNITPNSAPLRISPLLASDEGSYVCEMTTFPGGNQKAATGLSVHAIPQNSAEAVPVVAGEQEMTVATCTSANGRPPSRISWQTTLQSNVSTTISNHSDGTSTTVSQFRLTPTFTVDGEKITCIISHENAETPIPLILSVQYSPVVTIEGYDNNWHLNRNGAYLTCNARGNPPPTSYTWKTADGSPLPSNVHAKDNVLYVDQVDERVNKTFLCEVTNALGSRATHQDVLVREHAVQSQTNNAGAIAGGVIGGLLVLLLLAAVIFIVIRRGNAHSSKARGSYNPKTRVFGTGKPSQEFSYQEDSELDRPLKGPGPLRDSGLSPSLAEEDEEEEERMKYKVLEDDEEEERFNEVGPMLQLRPHHQHDPYLDDDMESQTDGSVISRTAVYV
ncbi:nectin-2 isoform 1-T1 [Discoglossus pictus]